MLRLTELLRDLSHRACKLFPLITIRIGDILRGGETRDGGCSSRTRTTLPAGRGSSLRWIEDIFLGGETRDGGRSSRTRTTLPAGRGPSLRWIGGILLGGETTDGGRSSRTRTTRAAARGPSLRWIEDITTDEAPALSRERHNPLIWPGRPCFGLFCNRCDVH